MLLFLYNYLNMKAKINQVSLVIATYNEEESIAYVLDELSTYDFHEIIIVDNASTDRTVEILSNYKVKVINQSKKGWGNAVIEGFNLAKGDYITYMDGDGSYNPTGIIKMLEITDKYDFLCCSRYKFNNKSEDDTLFRAFGNKIFTYICNKFLKLKLSDSLFFYPLIKKEDYQNINPKSQNFGLCIEMPLLLARNNLTYTDVLSLERKRYAGKSKVNAISDGFTILLEVLRMYR